MAHQWIDPNDIHIWVQTWHGRDTCAGKAACLASMDGSDTKGRYHVHRHGPEETPHDFYKRNIKEIHASGAKWSLRIEDDCLVNRHLVENVCSWDVPHREPDFGMGYVSVPGLVLEDKEHLGHGTVTGCPFRKHRGMHFGGGVLMRTDLMSSLADEMEGFFKTLHNDRPWVLSLSSLCWDRGLKCYFHLPALVWIDLARLRFSGAAQNPKDFGQAPLQVHWRRA